MCMTPPFREPRPDARAGFTLIEILVALLVSGLVVSGIFQVLQGNSRFVGMQSAREEVQQNARAALDLIAADLRAVPPSAIVDMQPDRIRFLQPRAWGVLCNTLKPATSVAWAVFPASVVPADAFFGRPHWGLAVEQTADPIVRTGSFRFVSGTTQTTSGDPCDAIQPDASADRLRLGFVTPGAAFVSSDTVAPGTQVMLFEEVRYDVQAGGSVPGNWIRRMAGYSGSTPNMQPMAGPVPAAGALDFTYLQADGSTPAVTADQVRQIDIRVVTQSRSLMDVGGTLQPQQVDTASTSVYLRNIPG